MIKEFCLFLKFYPSVKLICTGNSFTSDELILLKKMGVYSNVMHMFVDENQLMNLYRNAIAFIYPSLYEGFGIPILEAFSMECPVLLNDKSCFPEIAAGVGMLFCLDEHKSNLVDVLKKVINFSENERKQLIIGQNNRLKDFSWEASAVKLSNLYAECC